MKIVINTCYGGFSLSAKALKRLAELQGRQCYFFENKVNGYVPINYEDIKSDFWIVAFDIPNPREVLKSQENFHKLSMEERQKSNDLYTKHNIDSRPNDRADKFLVQVVEELGEEASGSCASLEVVEIPDDIEYTIEEYDGNEHIAEVHRTWR